MDLFLFEDDYRDSDLQWSQPVAEWRSPSCERIFTGCFDGRELKAAGTRGEKLSNFVRPTTCDPHHFQKPGPLLRAFRQRGSGAHNTGLTTTSRMVLPRMSNFYLQSAEISNSDTCCRCFSLGKLAIVGRVPEVSRVCIDLLSALSV